LASFAQQITKLHQIKAKEIKHHDYLDCMDKSKLPIRHYQAYMRLINKYKKLPLVLSHNDLSPDNLLWNGAEVIFIDYEWARMNNKYWDLANFIRETGLPEKHILQLAKLSNIKDITTLRAFIYITTNYALQWTYKMPQTKQILTYRKQIKTRLEQYYNRYTCIKSLI
jgi:thiamine kinase-like enzyme